MKFQSKYDFSQFVYLKTDIEQRPHIIISVQFLQGGTIQYNLKLGKEESFHFECEITNERNIVLATSN